MPGEIEIGGNPRRQTAAAKRVARREESRRDFMRHRNAARCRGTIEHKHIETSARQIGGCDEPVEPGSYHDCIVTLHASLPHHSTRPARDKPGHLN